MSLEELLKHSDESNPWYKQRAKLIRIVSGLSIVTLGVVALGFLLYPHRLTAREPSSSDEANSAALAELIKVKNQAAALSDDITKARDNNNSDQNDSADEDRRLAHGHGTGGGRSDVVNYDPGEGFNNLQAARENYYVPTGAVFQAQLLTPIKTSVEKSFVMAEVTHEYRLDQNRKILRGSRLIGTARLNPILKSVVVEFNKLVTPAGIETSIASIAMSRNALPEIEGLYFSDKASTYGTALAFGFLSGFADASRTRDLTLLTSTPSVSVNNSVMTGFSTASFQIADEMMRDIRANAIEYVVVPAGERVFVALTQKYEMNQGKNNETKNLNF